MTRMSPFSSPLMLGCDRLEQVLERGSRGANDGYPPYNIVQLGADRLRISLAVAGFKETELAGTVEHNQLHVRGRQEDEGDAVYLHRGIAARQFQRTFLLAEDIQVDGAAVDSGLLHIDLVRPEPSAKVRTVEIKSRGAKKVINAG